jgi:hypothetical protein
MSPASQIPSNPPIFHITHVDNLLGILHEGGLWCDSQRIARRLTSTNIGNLRIKGRRLRRAVTTAAGGMLGDYVPFNFCPRSVMLYVVNQGHDDYARGQDDIVHLVSTVNHAVNLGRAWAFTDRHAELGHALHFDELSKLDEVPWQVMDVKYWSGVREERQAEFLVREFFDWSGVQEIACRGSAIATRARQLLVGANHVPTVTVRPEWYY